MAVRQQDRVQTDRHRDRQTCRQTDKRETDRQGRAGQGRGSGMGRAGYIGMGMLQHAQGLGSRAKLCCSTMEPAAKLARLRDLRSKVPYISQRALAAVLSNIEEADVVENFNRNQVRAARNSDMKIKTPCGTLHQQLCMTDPEMSVEIQHPLAMMYHLASTSSAFADLLHRRAAARSPSVETPWKVVIYLDEVFPGNALAYKSARKSWCIYWSILDLGASALSDEDHCVC